MERPEYFMDLFDLIGRYGRLDEQSAHAIFSQIVETICSMNTDYGLVHRDIKASL
jgi:serine/threonine protein kinase